MGHELATGTDRLPSEWETGSLTVWDVLAAARRYWYLAVGGLAATALALVVVTNHPAVYHGQVNVVFLGPPGPNSPNTLQSSTQSLITTAGAVARVVGDSQSGAQPVSDTVTLVGEGITHGYSVKLPNEGGQWATNFNHPLLDVQASGSSPPEVQQTISSVVAKIDSELRALQDHAHVVPSQRITTLVSSDAPPIYRSAGSHTRAEGATVLLGLGLTATAIVCVDRVARRRRPTRRTTGAHALA